VIRLAERRSLRLTLDYFLIINPQSIRLTNQDSLLFLETLFYFLAYLGDRRFIGKYAAFDVVLSIIFGSTLSRGINGASAFIETIFAGLILVIMHWLISAIAFHITPLENKIKERSQVLIKNVQLCHQTMRHCHLTQADLVAALRLKCQLENFNSIEKACLERNGDISFSLKTRLADREPS